MMNKRSGSLLRSWLQAIFEYSTANHQKPKVWWEAKNNVRNSPLEGWPKAGVAF